ncbi:hypothetical protein BC830DRAFT_1174856 [Chytriomyces sp. MP71]|nr:hypothetical protein BC830DRAFT_1174856 [Chytriomyces sp. MP71]
MLPQSLAAAVLLLATNLVHAQYSAQLFYSQPNCQGTVTTILYAAGSCTSSSSCNGGSTVRCFPNTSLNSLPSASYGIMGQNLVAVNFFKTGGSCISPDDQLIYHHKIGACVVADGGSISAGGDGSKSLQVTYDGSGLNAYSNRYSDIGCGSQINVINYDLSQRNCTQYLAAFNNEFIHVDILPTPISGPFASLLLGKPSATTTATTTTTAVITTALFTTASFGFSSGASTFNPSNQTSTPSGPPIAAIAGGAVGGILLLALIAGAAFFMVSRRKRDAPSEALSSGESSNRFSWPEPAPAPGSMQSWSPVNSVRVASIVSTPYVPVGDPAVWTVPQTLAWLQSLRVEDRVLQTFSANRVDGEVLQAIGRDYGTCLRILQNDFRIQQGSEALAAPVKEPSKSKIDAHLRIYQAEYQIPMASRESTTSAPLSVSIVYILWGILAITGGVLSFPFDRPAFKPIYIAFGCILVLLGVVGFVVIPKRMKGALVAYEVAACAVVAIQAACFLSSTIWCVTAADNTWLSRDIGTAAKVVVPIFQGIILAFSGLCAWLIAKFVADKGGDAEGLVDARLPRMTTARGAGPAYEAL